MIYYGRSAGAYTSEKVVPLSDSACVSTGASSSCGTVQNCTYTLDGLTPGQWYFAVIAYGSGGIRSTVSNEATKVIQ